MAFGFSLTFVGFLLLSLAMKRHYRQLRGKQAVLADRQVVAFRAVGVCCLVSASAICIVSCGVALGLVYWAGFVTVTALIQALLLNYRTQWLIGCVLMALAASVVFEGMSYAIY